MAFQPFQDSGWFILDGGIQNSVSASVYVYSPDMTLLNNTILTNSDNEMHYRYDSCVNGTYTVKIINNLNAKTVLMKHQAAEYDYQHTGAARGTVQGRFTGDTTYIETAVGVVVCGIIV